MEQLKGTKKMFTDSCFPPKHVSITGGERVNKWRDVKWFRPSEFWKGKTYKLFKEGIEPNDIK
jgi:hypothetical protein